MDVAFNENEKERRGPLRMRGERRVGMRAPFAFVSF
jgi:hypothetical protein